MGSAFWNDIGLKPPPNLTCKLTSAEVSYSDLRKLSDVFWDALSVLQKNEALKIETATLSRLIYRMKYVFRSDKGFKSAQKVHHCLKRFGSLNLAPIFDNFFRTIPWKASEKDIYCPTRQMLEHILLSIQGLAALLCRIVHVCLDAAFHFKSRISNGQHWHVSLLCLGVISRVWALAKHLLNSCSKWYSTMVPYLNILKPLGQPWLPEGHTFPNDLTKWLSTPWIGDQDQESELLVPEVTSSSEHTREVQSKIESVFHPRFQSELDDIGTSVSRSLFVTEPSNTFESSKTLPPSDDVGEAVSRSSFAVNNQLAKQQKSCIQHSNISDLQKEGSTEKTVMKSFGQNAVSRKKKKRKSNSGDVSGQSFYVEGEHNSLNEVVVENKKSEKRKKKINTHQITGLDGEDDVANFEETMVEVQGKKKKRKMKTQGTFAVPCPEEDNEIKLVESVEHRERGRKKRKTETTEQVGDSKAPLFNMSTQKVTPKKKRKRNQPTN